jgi:hemoglobin
MEKTRSLILVTFFTSLFVFFLIGIWGLTDTFAQKKLEPSLYERLGGVYNIATVVDDFIERLYVNDILNANPKIKEARDRVPKAGLKFRVTALVSQVAGGPEKYTGRSMKEAHQHLNITEKDWKAMSADFKKALDKYKVPEREQKELIAIVEGTKKDIVIAKGEKPKK